MPAVEVASTKSAVIGHCVDYHENIDAGTNWLRDAEKHLDEDPPHDSLQIVKVLLDDQDKLLSKINAQRPVVKGDIEAGKKLMKEANAPQFVNKTVQDLEERWKETEAEAKDKHDSLKVRTRCYPEEKICATRNERQAFPLH